MKDFFTNFPKVDYSIDGIPAKVANIAVGELLIKQKIDISYVLWKREVMDEETPVSISQDLYGTVEYYWTILYVNNIINPYTEWYMGQTELESCVETSYTDTFADFIIEYEMQLNPGMTQAQVIASLLSSTKYKTGKNGLHHFEYTLDDGTSLELDQIDHYSALHMWLLNAGGLILRSVSNLQYETALNANRLPSDPDYIDPLQLEAWVDANYTSGINGVHHYERRVVGTWTQVAPADASHAARLLRNMPSNATGISPVTNLMYEKRLNDGRKNISVISPRFISDFANNFSRIMEGAA